MSVTIKTNHHRRPILDSSELTADERREFDYLDWKALNEGRDSASFFRYRGEVYDLGEIIEGADFAPGWDASSADTFFSGIVIRVVTDAWTDEYSVIVGHYYA